MKKLILASHGDLSKGMLNSISMIVGDVSSGIETYSLYPGESPVDYCQTLEEKVRQSDDQYVIVCDIKGGSVHTTLSKLVMYPNVVVISGMNMNVVLELLLTYQGVLLEREYAPLLNSARENITILSNALLSSEDEDF